MRALVLVLLAGMSPPVAAQQATGAFAVAYEAERDGRFADAARAYERILAREPVNVQALFGLERMAIRLETPERLLPWLDSALAQRPASGSVWGLKLRTLGALDRFAALETAAATWIGRDPRSAEPYRAWAFVLAAQGRLREARRALARGQEALGGSTLLAELAQVAVATGDWPEAARHWHRAARTDAGMLAAAGVGLAQAPRAARDTVVHVLLRERGDSTARLLAADLMIAWGRGDEAWTLLAGALPTAPQAAAGLLRRFADRARLAPSPETLRARGLALEELAKLSTGPAAQQARVDAARAYADAGERDAAARLLAEIAEHPSATPADAGGTVLALIGVAADAGRVEEAETRFHAWSDRLPAEQREALRARIVYGWLAEGEVPRARALLPADSSVETLVLAGWVALATGGVGTAIEAFRAAGPFTGTRAEVTTRTVMLARIQRIGADSLADLGAAIVALLAADTGRAIGRLADLGARLPPDQGGSDLLAWAGQLAVAADDDRAAALLEGALQVEPDGPQTPGVLYGLAELALRQGRTAEAVDRLEALILDHPTSAMVPQARRLLDQVRGRIPTS